MAHIFREIVQRTGADSDQALGMTGAIIQIIRCGLISLWRLDDHEFRLIGREAERVVALNDVTTAEALAYIDHQLERMGVHKLLRRAGVADGDVVWIGEFSFEYESSV